MMMGAWRLNTMLRDWSKKLTASSIEEKVGGEVQNVFRQTVYVNIFPVLEVHDVWAKER